MRFSTKTRYGIRAMIAIAKADQDKGILQKDISESEGISNKYLDQIIQSLKVSELICNVKGKKSGYVLMKEPSQITVYDIHNSFEPGICVIDCISKTYKCTREGGCFAKGFWAELNNKIIVHFKGTTLFELANGKRFMDA